jgi:hypothetical protein
MLFIEIILAKLNFIDRALRIGHARSKLGMGCMFRYIQPAVRSIVIL